MEREEWHRAQVHAKATRRRVVVEVPTVEVLECWELSWTPEVDQGAGATPGQRQRG